MIEDSGSGTECEPCHDSGVTNSLREWSHEHYDRLALAESSRVEIEAATCTCLPAEPEDPLLWSRWWIRSDSFVIGQGCILIQGCIRHYSVFEYSS